MYTPPALKMQVAMTPDMTSPPNSSPPSPKSTTTPAKPDFSLDLSTLPPLITPAPPSNTLLITNLINPSTFTPPNLDKIRSLLSHPVPLNSFSPLRSLRRIIISYPTTEACIYIRQTLESIIYTSALSSVPNATNPNNPNGSNHDDRDAHPLAAPNTTIKLYFGNPTPILGEGDEETRHLKAPSLGKLLFISPPPSPPCGWEIREEGPPNKTTHAEDLERALAGLNGFNTAARDDGGEGEDEEDREFRAHGNGFGKVAAEAAEEKGAQPRGVSREAETRSENKRKRSGSTTVVYHHRTHGDSEDLPAVMVEDTTGEGHVMQGAEEPESPGSGAEGGGYIPVHTARPPVELMMEE